MGKSFLLFFLGCLTMFAILFYLNVRPGAPRDQPEASEPIIETASVELFDRSNDDSTDATTADFDESDKKDGVIVEMLPDGQWTIPANLNRIAWPIAEHTTADGRKLLPDIRIPAIPSVSGFEVQAYDHTTGYRSDAMKLAQEARNPDWADEMESRIYAGIAVTRHETLLSFHVECRQTLCGVLAVFPRDDMPEPLLPSSFGKSLGFTRSSSQHVSAVDATFTADYFSGWLPPSNTH